MSLGQTHSLCKDDFLRRLPQPSGRPGGAGVEFGGDHERERYVRVPGYDCMI